MNFPGVIAVGVRLEGGTILRTQNAARASACGVRNVEVLFKLRLISRKFRLSIEKYKDFAKKSTNSFYVILPLVCEHYAIVSVCLLFRHIHQHYLYKSAREALI